MKYYFVSFFESYPGGHLTENTKIFQSVIKTKSLMNWILESKEIAQEKLEEARNRGYDPRHADARESTILSSVEITKEEYLEFRGKLD